MTKLTRVKRATRVQDILDICDALEGFLLVRPKPVAAPEQIRLRFDKTTYQREYMRGYMARRRAKLREGSTD